MNIFILHAKSNINRNALCKKPVEKFNDKCFRS